jgi:hypothetical protein
VRDKTRVPGAKSIRVKIKYYVIKFRASGVMGQIITEIAADSTTQVKQIVSNQYDGARNFEITGPFYR